MVTQVVIRMVKDGQTATMLSNVVMAGRGDDVIALGMDDDRVYGGIPLVVDIIMMSHSFTWRRRRPRANE